MDKKVIIIHDRENKKIKTITSVPVALNVGINTETATGYGCEMCTDLYEVYVVRGYDVAPIIEFMNENNIPIPE